jgi:hypothetical protein
LSYLSLFALLLAFVSFSGTKIPEKPEQKLTEATPETTGAIRDFAAPSAASAACGKSAPQYAQVAWRARSAWAPQR